MRRVMRVGSWAALVVAATLAPGCTVRGEHADASFGDAHRMLGTRTPSGELCDNGVDDNGEGRIDEECSCLPGESERCHVGPLATRGVGSCRDGVMLCEPGPPGTEFSTWTGECAGEIGPRTEECNGIDDDCDGVVDEGCACTAGAVRACNLEFDVFASPCRSGSQTCGSDGRWPSECGGAVAPAPDTCGNGIDDDCDGTIDPGCPAHDAGVDAAPSDAGFDAARPDVGRDAGSDVGAGGLDADSDAPARDAGTDAAPVDAGPRIGIVEIALADSVSCALDAAGTVDCWGEYAFVPGPGRFNPAPYRVPTITDAVAIAAGGARMCAVRAGGSVACWGYGGAGSFGDGTLTARTITTPVAVSGLTDAVSLGMGLQSTCARRADDTVVCWGRNGSGQLGDGSLTDRSTPVVVIGLTGVVELCGGYAHTCARRDDGSVVCWGEGASGQLGTGTTSGARMPTTPVVGLTDAIGIACGDESACAARATGDVVCWGHSSYGGIGTGTALVTSSTPLTVMGVDDAVAISGGFQAFCALRATGVPVCWGFNLHGGLGDGTTTDRWVATAVVGLGAAPTGLSRGTYHGCALLPSSVACWGSNFSGESGVPTGTADVLAPYTVLTF